MVKKTLFALTFLIIFTTSAYSIDEVPVRVKASDLKFDHESGVITAAGSVEISYENLTIYSDNAIINTTANLATAEGRVRVKHADYDIKSKSITYDMSTEASVVLNLKTVFSPIEIKGELYVAAHSLKDTAELKMGEFGTVTTCNYDEPHYRLESRWFDYYPDDKLIGYFNTMYAGPVPVMFMPYYVYNLKRKRSPFRFSFGENQVEGKFLKTTFDYFINNAAYGEFYVDSTSIKGPGYGIKHEYEINEANNGSVYLYKMEEQDTHISDYVHKIEHNIAIDGFSKLTLLNNSYYIYQIPAGRRYSNDSTVTYSKDSPDHKQSVNFSTSDDKLSYIHSDAYSISNTYAGMRTNITFGETKSLVGQKWDRVQQSISHSQDLLNADTNIKVDINYSGYVTDEGFIMDEKLENRVEINNKGSFYTLSLVENWYIDPDNRKFLGDSNYEYLERMPELTVNFNPVDMYYFNLKTTAGFARYHEAKYIATFGKMRHMTADRYHLGANLSRADSVGFGSTLTSGVGFNQYAYNLGDQRYQLTQSLRLNTSLWNFYGNEISWAKAKVDGNTPFFFESLGSQYEYIKDSMRFYYLGYASLSISAGYNYMNSTYDDILGNIAITPSRMFTLNISSGWSVETLRYRDLGVSVTFNPWDKFTNSAGLSYDMNNGTLLSANNMSDIQIGESWEDNWHLRMYNSYDIPMQMYRLRNLAVVKDLHCWEAIFTYNDYLKEYRFGMTLKSFPEFPLSYVSNPNGNYVDGFMNNMHFEQQSPRRY